MILATTQTIAENAVSLVSVTYSDVEPSPILNIDAARDSESYLPHGILPSLHDYDSFTVGDPETSMKQEADFTYEGNIGCGHQYHLHMETQAARASLVNGCLVVSCGTQYPQASLSAISAITGYHHSKIEVRCERTGGGYGGKITRHQFTAAAAAAATVCMKKTVRIQLDLNANMSAIGSRRPHELRYKVGVKKDGTLVALTGSYYSLQS